MICHIRPSRLAKQDNAKRTGLQAPSGGELAGMKRRGGLKWIGLSIAGVLLADAAPAWAYLDPNTQTQIVNSLLPIVGMLGAFVGVLLWPFKMVLRKVKAKLGRAAVACVLIGVLAAVICGGAMAAWLWFAHGDRSLEVGTVPVVNKKPAFQRVVLLGMDGLDPNVMDGLIAKGLLPNFERLKKSGTYSRLETTLPPETPVAWSSIATGCNPGKHGIFDFLHRDPQDYNLVLSIYKVNRENLLDRRDRRYLPVRHAPAFWAYTSQAGIPTTVVRWPAAFPPEQVAGRFVSGLGVPDICGRLGRYSFFTTQTTAPEGFKGRWCTGAWDGDKFYGRLIGPLVAGLTGRSESELKVVVGRVGNDRIVLRIGESPAVSLEIGQWSGWIPIQFKAGLSKKVSAQVKAYLGAVQPNLRLYVSTPQIDPADPYVPITYPDEYARELATAIGPYATLGMPEDVDAMKDGALPPEAFEQAMQGLFEERQRQFEYEYARFDKGLLAFVFDASDRIQHMFWKAMDKSYPAYDAKFAERFGHVIPNMYKQMDGFLGQVLSRADSGTVILVVSDHGFNSFRRSVGINSWLVSNGYMALRSPDGRNGRELFADVDWSRTRAYGVGFASVYLNLKGREKQGIVEPGGPAEALCEELAAKLRALKDPAGGAPAVREAYLTRDAYRGQCAGGGPDLVVGFAAGFRAENANALGGAPAEVFADNTGLWSGDHLMDPQVVPGVLFSSVKLKGGRPRCIDVAPTVLGLLGISRPETMDGEPLH